MLRNMSPIKFPTLAFSNSTDPSLLEPWEASAAVPGGDRAAPVFGNAVWRSSQLRPESKISAKQGFGTPFTFKMRVVLDTNPNGKGAQRPQSPQAQAISVKYSTNEGTAAQSPYFRQR